MATTYAQLSERHALQLKASSKTGSLKQVERNHMSAIRAFLKTVGKSETSPVGAELADDFDFHLRHHLETSGLSERSQVDRKSLLNQWKNSFTSMGESVPKRMGRARTKASDFPSQLNPFEKALRDALNDAKLAPKTAAVLAGIPTAAIGRWTRGGLPNIRTVSYFEKLEEVLGAENGSLLEAYHKATGKNQGGANEYRERERQNREDHFKLSERDVNEALKSEWQELLHYKTTRIGGDLKRANGNTWSVFSPSESTMAPRFPHAVGRNICPTASIVWSSLVRYFSFLRRPVESGGYGLGRDVGLSLAWLAVPEAVDAFFEFQRLRSGGLTHRGHKNFAALVMSMTHPSHGFLTQQGAYREKLPAEYQGVDWLTTCSKVMQVARIWKAKAVDLSRDPAVPIQFMLDMDEPFAPIFKAMKSLRDIGDRAVPKSVYEAVARRDELLLGLLISNPLRAKNLVMLTYHENNSGNIYQTSSGQWRIRIRGNLFKNKARVGKQVYDVPVAKWLWKLLEDYVKWHRPVLLGANNCNNFLLGRNGKRFVGLGAQVKKLTKRLIPESGGFATHAFRHLVASDWLTKNHNDFLTVAELLNDTIAVVMANYAHLKKDVAFGRYEAHVEKSIQAAMYG